QPGTVIPMIVGGDGDGALRRAARYGDGWAVSAAGDQLATDAVAALKERIDTLGRFCEEEGRSADDLLLVGQAFLGGPPEQFKIQADLGIDVVDLMTFAPADQVLDQPRAFMNDVAPP